MRALRLNKQRTEYNLLTIYPWLIKMDPAVGVLLEGCPDHPVTQGLGGSEVVPQHPVIAFWKLCSFNMGPETAKLLNLGQRKVLNVS